MRMVRIFYSISVPNVCEWKKVCLRMHEHKVARGLEMQILGANISLLDNSSEREQPSAYNRNHSKL